MKIGIFGGQAEVPAALPGSLMVLPTEMRSLVMPLATLIALTVVPWALAILPSVSPDFTTYFVPPLVALLLEGLVEVVA